VSFQPNLPIVLLLAVTTGKGSKRKAASSQLKEVYATSGCIRQKMNSLFDISNPTSKSEQNKYFSSF
jgi:hypothetical protein